MFLSKDDIIEYRPTGQIGIIKKIHQVNDNFSYKLILQFPSQSIWCNAKDIKLLNAVG